MNKNSELVLKYIGEDFWSCPVYRDQFKCIWKDVSLGMYERPSLNAVIDNDVEGEPDVPMREGIKYTILPLPKEMRISEEQKFQYMMLGRLQSDCDYYLGHGNRDPSKLWDKDEKDHLEHMKTVWNSFSEEEKPQWLTWEQLKEYEKEMLRRKEGGTKQ